MSKNAKIIALVSILIIAIVASLVTVTVYATTHGDQRTSQGFTVVTSGSNCTITGYNGKDLVVSVPAKISGKRVAGVKSGAFSKVAITEIEFSDSIKELTFEDGVFSNMTSLDYVKLPSAMKEIPKDTFKGCTNLTHIVLPAKLVTIGEAAFYGCTKLSYSYIKEEVKDTFVFPDGLESIGKNAFYNDFYISAINANDKLKTIGEGAFNKCSGLNMFNISKDNVVTTIEKNAFAGCSKLTSKKEDPLYFSKIETIGETAFSGLSSYFEYFRFPNTLKTLGDGVFENSVGLATAEFADDIDITNFGKRVFQYASGLQCVTTTSKLAEQETTTKKSVLPDSVKDIPELTFSGCFKLLNTRDFEIGKNVTSIGDGAFALYNYSGTSSASRTSYHNYMLTTNTENESFKMVELDKFQKRNESSPSRLRHSLLMSADGKIIKAYIGAYTTYNTTDEQNFDSYRDDDKKKTAFKFLDNDKIRNSVTTISPYAFAGVRFDTMVVIPGISKIGANAFYKSEINAVLFDNSDCALDTDTFKEMPTSLGVFVVTGTAAGTISEQINALMEKGFKVIFGSMDMPA